MALHIRRMTQDDIPAGMTLKEQNLWNTMPEDWQRQLDLEPEGCFAATDSGQVIGTACACVFESVAWVNLVLVNQTHRGRGIGSSLMGTVLAWLDERRIPSIRLDATPLGRPMYEKLGFTAEYELTRYEGVMPSPVAPDPAAVVVAQASDLSELARFDQRITGTNREKLIRYQFQHVNCYLVRNEQAIAGYAAFRPGARARHVGPCLGSADACRQLLTRMSYLLRGDLVFLDVPLDHAEANAYAVALGMAPQRRLTRMGRGVPVREQLDQYWCSFGPEKG